MNQAIHQEKKHGLLAQQMTLSTLGFRRGRLPDPQRGSTNSFTTSTENFLRRARRFHGGSFSSARATGDARQSNFVTTDGKRKGMMAIGVPQQNEGAASRVARRYTYIKGEQVRTFLTHHPDVAKTLLAAVPEIEKIFDRGVTLTLQVLVDQDGENDVSLFARIQTPKPVREAISLRKQFYREWWMKQEQALESPLNFEVESV